MMHLTQMPRNRGLCFTSRWITNHKPRSEAGSHQLVLSDLRRCSETANRPLGGLRLRANLVHSCWNDLLSTVFPFIRWEADYSGSAAIPKEEARRGLFSSPPHRRGLSERCLIVSSTLQKKKNNGATAWDFTGKVYEPLSPGDTATHLLSR